MSGLIVLCAKGEGRAFHNICGSADGLIALLTEPSPAYVRSYIEGSLQSRFKLSFKSYANGYVKRVVRGKVAKSISFSFRVRGRGHIRSSISGLADTKAIAKVRVSTSAKVMSPIYTTKNIDIMLSHKGEFIPEVSMPVFNETTLQAFKGQTKIEIEVLKESLGSDEYRGDRKVWAVARVLYEGCPVMFLINYSQSVMYPYRYIVDRHRYQYMVYYLWHFIKSDKGGEGPLAVSGIMNDRIRIVQPHYTKIEHMPRAIQDLIHEFGIDYEPVKEDKVFRG